MFVLVQGADEDLQRAAVRAESTQSIQVSEQHAVLPHWSWSVNAPCSESRLALMLSAIEVAFVSACTAVEIFVVALPEALAAEEPLSL